MGSCFIRNELIPGARDSSAGLVVSCKRLSGLRLAGCTEAALTERCYFGILMRNSNIAYDRRPNYRQGAGSPALLGSKALVGGVRLPSWFLHTIG